MKARKRADGPIFLTTTKRPRPGTTRVTLTEEEALFLTLYRLASDETRAKVHARCDAWAASDKKRRGRR